MKGGWKSIVLQFYPYMFALKRQCEAIVPREIYCMWLNKLTIERLCMYYERKIING